MSGVLESAVPAINYQAKPVQISLATEQFGGVPQAQLVGSQALLALTQAKGRISFTVSPNPVATLVLKESQQE